MFPHGQRTASKERVCFLHEIEPQCGIAQCAGKGLNTCPVLLFYHFDRDLVLAHGSLLKFAQFFSLYARSGEGVKQKRAMVCA